MSLINENSTTKEIVSEIRYTFMEKEFEEYQGIVVRREEDLKTALKKLKEDYGLVKEEHDLLERNHCSSELEKLELEEELKKIKIEFDSLKKKRFSSESETHYADQNLKKPKIETDEEAVMELRKENEKLKEEIELYRKKFPEHLNRMACIEEMLADFKEKNASNFRAENVVDDDDDDHSPDDSISSQIRNSAEIQSSNLQKEGKSEFFQVANVDDLINIDVDEEEETDSEQTLSAIPEHGEASAQMVTGEIDADSGEAAQNNEAALDPSVQVLPSTAENVTSTDLGVPPTDPVSALTAVPLRSISKKSKKRHKPASSGTSASDSSFDFEDVSTEDFADSCYRLGKSLYKKTSGMAGEISALQQKVASLEEANAKVTSLEEANRSLMSSETIARQEIEQLKAKLAEAEGLLFTQEEQLKLRDQQLKKMNEENQQHLATAKKMKADFDESLRQMEEAPAQNVIQKVVAGYKASPQTYEEIQIILAPALRRGYTLGVDEAKPADLVISTLPNHKLYDKKAGEIFTRRYDEYKSGEDIIRKYAKKKSAQSSAPSSS